MSGGRHGRDEFLIGAQVRTMDADGNTVVRKASPYEMSTKFMFSGFVSDDFRGQPNSDDLLAQLAVAMTHHAGKQARFDASTPAGYTYLGQFIDHDLTLDSAELDLRTIPAERMASKRSPTLDLDSLYGDGPADPKSAVFYQADGASLITGTPERGVPGDMLVADGDGYDLPRRGPARDGERKTEREAKIPDIRNDENLAVGQLHAAMIRFHNKVVKTLRGTVAQERLFEHAREQVTKHYQWMIRHDYLPRIASNAVLQDVFQNGRKVFEKDSPERLGTMPVEFSGAAFRLGHSMIRTSYEWNANFGTHAGAFDSGHLFRLFRFSGTSGTLVPAPHAPGSEADIDDLERQGNTAGRLPANWVADWLRLFDFKHFEANNAGFKPKAFNMATAIDTHLVDPLAMLPGGSFGAAHAPLLKKRNLAFRNLARGRMLGLPSGQQMVEALNQAGCGIKPLDRGQLFEGRDGIEVLADDVPNRDELLDNAPLWFYILREAEFNGNRLGGVGARIVAETMHRALQGSRYSILNDAGFRPQFGPGAAQGRFNMEDLLHFAFDGRPELLNPFLKAV